MNTTFIADRLIALPASILCATPTFLPDLAARGSMPNSGRVHTGVGDLSRITGQCHGHAVLEHMCAVGVDAVHEEREGHGVAAQRAAVAHEAGDRGQRAGLALAAPARRPG